MKKILSVFLNIDRVYLTGVTISEDGISLDYINSTIHHVDIENISTEESKNGISELNKYFFEMDFNPDEVSITLPSESVLVTKFPGKRDLSEDDLKKLVSLEVRQMYPNVDQQEFKINIVPLLPDNPKLHQMMAIIVPNEDFNVIDEVLQILN